VFYPGAKVEPEACAARLSGLVAEEGMTVVIPDPWLHLALFDRRDATAFTAEAPHVNDWFVGGHSMGGCGRAGWPRSPRACCCWAPTAPRTADRSWLCLLPYLGWVTFAAALNLGIALLN